VEPNLSSAKIDDEVSVFAQLGLLNLAFPMSPCVKCERNAAGISARCNCEVVLQISLIAVVHQVDTGIDSFVLHLAIVGNVCMPLFGIVPDEVVACT